MCSQLEKILNKQFLHLACRHHIYEIVLRGVFELYWPATSGPNVTVFNRFQQAWPNINKNRYKTGLDDELVAQVIVDKKDDILSFISEQLEVYYSILFLTIIHFNINNIKTDDTNIFTAFILFIQKIM